MRAHCMTQHAQKACLSPNRTGVWPRNSNAGAATPPACATSRIARRQSNLEGVEVTAEHDAVLAAPFSGLIVVSGDQGGDDLGKPGLGVHKRESSRPRLPRTRSCGRPGRPSG